MNVFQISKWQAAGLQVCSRNPSYGGGHRFLENVHNAPREMPNGRKKSRRREPEPDSDVDTVVEYTSDEEAGYASASPFPHSRSPSPSPRGVWKSNKAKWGAARGFCIFVTVGFVFLDIYARESMTLWWTLNFHTNRSHSAGR